LIIIKVMMTPATSTDNQIISCVRLMVHSVGLDSTNRSWNHWTIYLILQEGGSVRLNMFGDPENGSFIGLFTTRSSEYSSSTSSIANFDYTPCSGLRVGQCIQLIERNGRTRYQMTDAGKGCRYWV
jgi:hypothetical protein